MFWGNNRNGMALCVFAAVAAINLAAGAYVYPMRPHSIDPLLLSGGGGFGAGGAGGGGGGVPQMPKKRPFCNAFTGCGRKRSDPEMATDPMQHPLPPLRPTSPAAEQEAEQRQNGQRANALNGFDGDTLVDLLDLNSEPAIEDLMRQIMSQAKMWEAIQEANREMIMQKNDRNAMANEPSARNSFPTVAFNSQ